MEFYVMSDLQLCKSYDHEKKKFFTKGNFQIAMKTKNLKKSFYRLPNQQREGQKASRGKT